MLNSEAFLHLSVPVQNGFNFGIPYLISFKGHSIYQSITLMKNCKSRNKILKNRGGRGGLSIDHNSFKYLCS